MRGAAVLGASLAFAAVLSGCAGALAQQPAAAQTVDEVRTGPDSILLRMAIVTADADRSIRFYRDVFGYSVTYDGDISQSENRALLNLVGDDSARFVVLKGATSLNDKALPGASIGLLQISGHDPLPKMAQPAGNALATGQSMMAIQTNDIDHVMKALQDLGMPIVAGPIVAHSGADTEIVTRDPDGTRIHVVQQR